MNTIDIILLVILGFGAVKGYLNGFIVEVASFFGFFIGLILALQLTIPVTAWLFSGSDYFDFIAVGVFISLFVLLTVGIKMGARMLKKMIDVTIFGTLDNVAGGITGIIKWGFLVSMIVWVFESVGFSFHQELSGDSRIFPYLVKIGPAIFSWLGSIIPFFQEFIDSLDSIPATKEEYLTIVY